MKPTARPQVEIRAPGAPPRFCDGPNEAGECSAVPPGAVVPCASCALHVVSAPDDIWVFTAPSTSRTCPLGWLEKTPFEPARGPFSSYPPSIWG